MTRTRPTEEQIIAVLKDAQAGVSVQDLCRKHGISDATCYKWKFSMSHVQDYRRTSRRMLKKARLLILLRPRVARARGSSQPPRPLFQHPASIECLPGVAAT
jgi:putative transposase